MFPWIYEFRWTAGHIIFLGVFFCVVIALFATVTLAVLRAFAALRKNRHEAIQWEADFEDLPVAARACRHEMSGEVQKRTCDHEFDCRSCVAHPAFLAQRAPQVSAVPVAESVVGFPMPLDRYYHRGHTWVKDEGDGVFAIGLDAFGTRMINNPDNVELPAVGTELKANGKGWMMRKQNAALRILSPIDGVVIEQGGADKGWYLRVRAGDSAALTRHLLRGEEVRPWIMREFERLQFVLSADGVGMSLADGGELVPDMWKDAPQVDWDGVWGEMFLQA